MSELIMGSVAYESQTSLPEEVQKLRLEFGDIIVINVDEFISEATAEQLRTKMREKFPGHEVLVFGKGVHISVIKRSQSGIGS